MIDDFDGLFDNDANGYVPVHTNKKEYQFVSHGFGCYVIVNENLFSREGYIALPLGHPLWGVDYLARDFPDLRNFQPISFTEECEGFWVIGFDCHHGWDCADIDLVPPDKLELAYALGVFRNQGIGHVWSLDDVVRELTNIAGALAEIDEKGEY